MPKITLGPVIGKVTDTTARILIETDENAELVCTATDSSGKTSSVSGKTTAHRPFVFVLAELQPNTQYRITFTGADGNLPNSRVRTYATEADKMNIGAVSCNFPSRSGERDMWRDLLDRFVMPNDIDLLLHVGDQVYGDSVFDKAVSMIRANDPKGKKAQNEAILEMYRGLYRKNWTEPATREVLANVPNLMIWDDHELRNSWGSRREDYDPDSVSHRIGTLGRQVYREYQRQLWDDFNTNAAPDSSDEHHFHIWCRIGVMFVDQRGSRAFGRDAARPFLGTRQWNDISDQLKNGALSKVRALVVVTSVPLIYLTSGLTDLGDGLISDLIDHWSLPEHTKEQIEMIRALREWKERVPEQRELLVVGGDVHIGATTEIKHHGETIFKQLITSPITNKPPISAMFFGLKSLLTKREVRLTDSYSYNHDNLTNKRNYGIIMVRIPTNGLPKVEGTLQRDN